MAMPAVVMVCGAHCPGTSYGFGLAPSYRKCCAICAANASISLFRDHACQQQDQREQRKAGAQHMRVFPAVAQDSPVLRPRFEAAFQGIEREETFARAFELVLL